MADGVAAGYLTDFLEVSVGLVFVRTDPGYFGTVDKFNT